MTIHEQLDDLLRLSPDWNSYGAPAINPACVAKARQIAQSLPTGVPEPLAVPMSDGGVQLEWHRGGVDLEIVVSPPDGRVSFFADDGNICEEEDKETEF